MDSYDVKTKLVFDTIGACANADPQIRTTSMIFEIIGYSVIGGRGSEVFLEKLCRDDHDAALRAFFGTHSIKAVRAACNHVRYHHNV